VPDLNENTLIQFNDWTLRIHPASQSGGRLLLLIHGFTGDENSMWVFTRDLPSSYSLIAPRAPHPLREGGYSWRSPQPGTFGFPTFEQLKPAAEALLTLVDEYQASVGIDAPDFDVMGFSQGAVMSGMMGILYPQRVRKIGILAGFLPAGAETEISHKPFAGKKIFVTHGTKDETVPVERAYESIRLLKQAGAEVIFCEDHVGHKVGVNCIRSLYDYFKD